MLKNRSWPNSPQTLVLAGGGNRCWWQAGLLSEIMQAGVALPPKLVATSAGAAIATAAMCDAIHTATEACRLLYANNKTVFQWNGLRSGHLKFAHQHIYPNWIASFVNANNLAQLHQNTSRLLVAVSRPAPKLGLAISVGLGTLAYIVDKKLLHQLHPLLPRWLGLQLDFLPLHECKTHEDAIQLLCAAAAPPPILPALNIRGKPAFDGGYTDNAPMPKPLGEDQSLSLTLLTRHYPKRPAIFSEKNRWYWQPSEPVPVSTWNCTNKTSIDAALNLGRKDARTWIEASSSVYTMSSANR